MCIDCGSWTRRDWLKATLAGVAAIPAAPLVSAELTSSSATFSLVKVPPRLSLSTLSMNPASSAVNPTSRRASRSATRGTFSMALTS